MLNNVHALANWQYFVVRGGGGGGGGCWGGVQRHNLWRIGKENHSVRKVGVTDHLRELAAVKVNSTTISPMCG